MLNYDCLSGHSYRTSVRNVLYLILCTHGHMEYHTSS